LIEIERPIFFAGSPARDAPSSRLLTNMSLPSPPNVLPLEGQIDLHVSAKVADSLAQLIKDKPARLVVDLSGVNYIDSSGLAVLINGMRDMEDFGGIFILAGVRDEVRPILESARLENFFLIFPSVDEALAAP
jgi:anti-sigma B factor antagonist